MKVYVIEYDILVGTKTEHRVEPFTDFNEFRQTVLSLEGKYYISNRKVYCGEAKEANIGKVINPDIM